jgi:hypothetical protein
MCIFLIKANLIFAIIVVWASPHATTDAYTSSDTSPLELNLCDLYGLAPVTSSCGYFFFLLMLMPIIIFTWVYPLKMKSRTQFKSLVELQLNHRIKSVQTDGGGKFRPFIDFLTS